MEKDTAYGWVVVFTTFTVHALTHGIVYSYGILFVSLREAFHGTKAELGWIVSLTTGSLYLSGPLASILVRRLGNRAVSIIGSLISSFGYILTIFSPSLYFMYFSLGFLTGLGFGLQFIPCVVDVTIRFDKYRALACGTSVAGAGFGAFLVSPLIRLLLEEYGWRGTLLIQSALLLNCIPCSMSFTGKTALTGYTKGNNSSVETTKTTLVNGGDKRPVKYVTSDKCYETKVEDNSVETKTLLKPLMEIDSEQQNMLKETENTETEDNDFKAGSRIYTPLRIDRDTENLTDGTSSPKDATELNHFMNAHPTPEENFDKCLFDRDNVKQRNVADCNAIIMEYNNELTVFYDHNCSKDRTDKEIRQAIKEKTLQISTEEKGHKDMSCKRCYSGLTFFKLLKRKEMMLFYSSQVLFITGLYQPFVFIPELAISLGISEQSAAWIISTIGISTVIGRIVLGYLSDRQFMNRICLYKTALLLAGITTAVVPLFTSFGLLVSYAVMYGLTTAVLLSQTTVVLVEIVGMESMADAMGLNNMFSGFGALLGPPLLGLMYDKTNSFTASFLASGLGMVLGFFLQCLMPCVASKHHR